ncbi:hypothetical protein I79_009410 [Cricetulus griseus]|uniref:Uncharacterized protein n=1 Tax=Cricetulus griseus TaxID=10029 RepID=G3HFP7_CRIGR|nr:hypothetical protein I79_009410 [Cricetulus griseus]
MHTCTGWRKRKECRQRVEEEKGAGNLMLFYMNYTAFTTHAKISAHKEMQLQTTKTCYYFVLQLVGNIRMFLDCTVLDE